VDVNSRVSARRDMQDERVPDVADGGGLLDGDRC